MFTGPGTYTFSSLSRPGRCIDIPSEIAHKEEGRIQLFPCNGAAYQQWVVEPLAGSADVFVIRALLGRNKVLGIAGGSRDDLARIYFQLPNGSDLQSWRFEQAGADAYRVYNAGSGLCIDLKEEAAGSGGPLQQRPRSEAKNQLWAINPRG